MFEIILLFCFWNGFRYRTSRWSSRRVRKRVVMKNGECNVVQTNVAKRRRRYLADIFTTMVDIQWRWTVLIFTLSFMLSWLAFAVIWWLIAFTHGDLEAEHLPGTWFSLALFHCVHSLWVESECVSPLTAACAVKAARCCRLPAHRLRRSDPSAVGQIESKIWLRSGFTSLSIGNQIRVFASFVWYSFFPAERAACVFHLKSQKLEHKYPPLLDCLLCPSDRPAGGEQTQTVRGQHLEFRFVLPV